MKYTMLLVTLTMMFISCGSNAQVSDSKPITHEAWTALLKKHVAADGNVDYKGFIADSAALNSYLQDLMGSHPNETNWSEADRMAYWINAYNAFTIKLVTDYYPVESIKDIKKGLPFINSVWDLKFITIEGQEYDLNNIEHGILRKEHEEPRIHFAVNCASVSCPILRNEAYTAEKLEAQLADQTRIFLTSKDKNKISKDHVELSKIFSWFKGDFTKDGSLIDFINAQGVVQVNDDAKVDFLEYDWNLNE